MKQPSFGPWLLAGAAFLFGATDAAPEEPVHYLPPSVPRPPERPGDPTYPVYKPVHSLHDLDLNRTRHVHKCLQDWCEEREFIWELGGKIRCKSDHDTGENVVAWICNMGYYQKACTSAMLNQAAKELIKSTSDYTVNSPSGHIYYSAQQGHQFIFGWDTYCDGSPTCGGYRDPTVVCENKLKHYRDRPAPKAVQYESIANAYGSVHHDGYQQEGEANHDGEKKSGKKYEVYDGYISENEDDEFEKYQNEERNKDRPIWEPPVNNTHWPHSQDDVEGADEHNQYYGPKEPGFYKSTRPTRRQG
ncbi:hypothetical protein B0T21DRAFT_352156 [Apiosordaria backusii]|uniref:Uncharacterized protein n=1 Tax=Apiosordaria backusii TaxID=314023 RepID=A0AA40AE62_9PEZI|nr:hypothetical protein B0T21DRAFT_352156 [Apiosordaria backusii]